MELAEGAMAGDAKRPERHLQLRRDVGGVSLGEEREREDRARAGLELLDAAAEPLAIDRGGVDFDRRREGGPELLEEGAAPAFVPPPLEDRVPARPHHERGEPIDVGDAAGPERFEDGHDHVLREVRGGGVLAKVAQPVRADARDEPATQLRLGLRVRAGRDPARERSVFGGVVLSRDHRGDSTATTAAHPPSTIEAIRERLQQLRSVAAPRRAVHAREGARARLGELVDQRAHVPGVGEVVHRAAKGLAGTEDVPLRDRRVLGARLGEEIAAKEEPSLDVGEEPRLPTVREVGRVDPRERSLPGATARVAAIVHPPPVGGWSVPEIALFPSHDIALLRLAAPVPSTPVKLAQSAGRPGSPIRLLGWGHTCVGRPFNVGCTIPVKLQELDTVLSESAVCASVFANPVNELCVGAYGAPGACNGDSGGPAIVNVGGAWRLAGVTSRAAAPYYMCGANPAVYTNATEWRAWINGVTGLAL